MEFLRYLKFLEYPCPLHHQTLSVCILCSGTTHQSIDVSACIRLKQWANRFVLHIRGSIQEDFPMFLKWSDIGNDIKIGQILLMEENLHQLIGSLPQYLQGFIHPRWIAAFLLSQYWCFQSSKIMIKCCHSDRLFQRLAKDLAKFRIARVVLELCFCPVPKGIVTSSQPCCVSRVFRLLEFKLYRSIRNKLSS